MSAVIDRPVPCAACRLEVLMLRHVRTGRSAPIELVPVLNGNVQRVGTGHYELVKPDPAVARLVNHFARCPEAGRFHRT